MEIYIWGEFYSISRALFTFRSTVTGREREGEGKNGSSADSQLKKELLQMRALHVTTPIHIYLFSIHSSIGRIMFLFGVALQPTIHQEHLIFSGSFLPRLCPSTTCVTKSFPFSI